VAETVPDPHRGIAIRLSGSGGDGIISAGEILAGAAARAGWAVGGWRETPTEVSGGHAGFTLRLGAGRVLAPPDRLDWVIDLGTGTAGRHAADLGGSGLLLHESGGLKPELPGGITAIGLPFEAIARSETGNGRSRNAVALGTAAAILGIPAELPAELAAIRYGWSGAAGEGGRRALRAGHALALERLGPSRLPAAPAGGAAGQVLLSGNEAVARGAVAAGCRRFYGYPITPATEILERLAVELPRRGGSALSVEDELAALAMCLGSSFAGDKAMTATSGPGFSLMAELLGLAAAAEIPVVVVDVQRAGPCTGLPTRTEQGDLLAAVFGGHGDFPRIVVAPIDVADAFHQTVHAFNLAERWQVPVILLSDQDLAQRLQTVPEPDDGTVAIVERTREAPGDGAFRRYAPAPDGVSPMPPPGTPGRCWRASGQEHDESGLPSADPENHVRMMRRRAAKLDGIPDDACGAETFGAPAAETLVLGWGSTYGAVREAVERLCAAGTPVRGIYPKRLWPYPARRLEPEVARARRVVVPEASAGGGWARLVEMHHGVRAIRVARFDGRPFRPGDLADRIEEIALRGR